jgi:hypothetical protein
VPVRVFEIEGLDTCGVFVPVRQSLRGCRSLPNPVLSEPGIRLLHIVGDDGDVLEPAVIAARTTGTGLPFGVRYSVSSIDSSPSFIRTTRIRNPKTPCRCSTSLPKISASEIFSNDNTFVKNSTERSISLTVNPRESTARTIAPSEDVTAAAPLKGEGAFAATVKFCPSHPCKSSLCLRRCEPRCETALRPATAAHLSPELRRRLVRRRGLAAYCMRQPTVGSG